MKQLLKALLIAIALVILIKIFAFTSCTIPSTGMENTLYTGDRVIVNKWSYGFRVPLATWWGYHRWCEDAVQRGDIILFNNPAPKSDRQPVETRELFINRCIGIPGDTLMLNNERIVAEDQTLSPDSKLLYAYAGDQEDRIVQAMKRANITHSELVGVDQMEFIRSFSYYEIYKLRQELGDSVQFRSLQTDTADGIHPFVVPSRGQTIQVYPWNAQLLYNTIIHHEKCKAELRGDTILIEGQPIESYTFTKDYHWVASNNSMSLCDSRQFGLVPKDHIIGRAALIWFSKDTEQPFWKGFRWKRFFRSIH